MKKIKKRINHDFILVSSDGDENIYRVTIKIPMEMGWIERVKLSIGTSKEKKVFQLNH